MWSSAASLLWSLQDFFSHLLRPRSLRKGAQQQQAAMPGTEEEKKHKSSHSIKAAHCDTKTTHQTRTWGLNETNACCGVVMRHRGTAGSFWITGCWTATVRHSAGTPWPCMDTMLSHCDVTKLRWLHSRTVPCCSVL